MRPKINLTLKLEVTKAPLADRRHVQDVAETLEEILALIHDKGAVIPADTHLPSRPHRIPGKTMNQAK